VIALGSEREETISSLCLNRLGGCYTSDYHMKRARAIAAIVLGSQGIAVTPVQVSTRGDESETLVRLLRDCGRSLLWVVTGRTGASFNPKL